MGDTRIAPSTVPSATASTAASPDMYTVSRNPRSNAGRLSSRTFTQRPSPAGGGRQARRRPSSPTYLSASVPLQRGLARRRAAALAERRVVRLLPVAAVERLLQAVVDE